MQVMGKNDEVEARHLLSSVKGPTDLTSIAGRVCTHYAIGAGHEQQKKSLNTGRGQPITWVLARPTGNQNSALAMFC
jgi:hypothetical protein